MPFIFALRLPLSLFVSTIKVIPNKKSFNRALRVLKHFFNKGRTVVDKRVK